MPIYDIFFIVIAAVSFTLKLISLKNAIKEKNKGKIKVDLFFLFLMILVVAAVLIFTN